MVGKGGGKRFLMWVCEYVYVGMFDSKRWYGREGKGIEGKGG